MMTCSFEVGYTPTNLRQAIAAMGVTQASLAMILGVSDRQLRRWLVEDLESKSHADMPHRKWKAFYALLATANVV